MAKTLMKSATFVVALLLIIMVADFSSSKVAATHCNSKKDCHCVVYPNLPIPLCLFHKCICVAAADPPSKSRNELI
ncbi:hypothetical protein P3S68_029048 [Capsicum galapagoense]